MGSNKKTAFLFPGQGSQYVGMGKDFCVFEPARLIFEQADDLLKEKFSQVIWEGPADLLTETRNCQLAIFVTSVAILHALKKEIPELIAFAAAGLSLGEYTALYAAGKLSFEEALLLIQKRALFMDEACRKEKGLMAAVLSLSTEKIEDILNDMREKESAKVWIANYNCPGQTVISGDPASICAVTEKLKEAGAKRVIPLQVHGAFHSPFMALAMKKLEPYIRKSLFFDSSIPVVFNASGDFAEFKQIPDLLIEQVVSSVRWQQSILRLKEEGALLLIEMGCGKTLTGLNRKIAPDIESISIEKLTDLESFLGMFSKT